MARILTPEHKAAMAAGRARKAAERSEGLGGDSEALVNAEASRRLDSVAPGIAVGDYVRITRGRYAGEVRRVDAIYRTEAEVRCGARWFSAWWTPAYFEPVGR
jgi:hypothetical protein